MHARTTLFEIDTLRISLDTALDLFRERVMPKLRTQPGFEGALVLQTPAGKGLLLSFWEGAEAAGAAIESGFYDDQVAELVMLLRQPPGREHYEVVFHELNAAFRREDGREGGTGT